MPLPLDWRGLALLIALLVGSIAGECALIAWVPATYSDSGPVGNFHHHYHHHHRHACR